jgi:DNA-binding winged helix-turn-helix (wHTH) protein/Tfp pilus assembly protein PilF
MLFLPNRFGRQPRSCAMNIGDWRIHADTNEIVRGGVAVRVEPKAMDVLVTLARAGGRVVTRDELLAAVWPGVIVGDEAITQAVIKLRRALRDDSRAPRYIETIPKRGYRLVAAVSGDDSPAPRALSARRWSAPRAPMLAFVAGLVLVVGIMAGSEAPDVRPAAVAPNAEAQDLFERGQARLLARTAGENQEARALFRAAIERDPTFARAYAGLAMTYALDSRLGGDDGAARALELAETARLIDPGSPDVYWVLGFVHAQERRHREAIRALRRAIQLDGTFADAYALLGGIYTYMGRPDESIPLLRTAMRLRPEGGYLYFLLLGRAYLFQGDVEQALINLRAAAMRNPVDVETRAYLAAALAAAGDDAKARWETVEIRALRPDFSTSAWLATYPMADARQEERLASLLAHAGL